MNHPESSVLELLRCPVTHSKLRAMEGAELKKLNDQIRADNVNDRKGNSVSAEIEAGLINADQSIAWSIQGSILQLIADEGIELGNILKQENS